MADVTEQLEQLMQAQLDKAEKLAAKLEIDEEERLKDLAEMKSVTTRLEAVDTRLAKMKIARREYKKTLQESEFALRKMEETAAQMASQFAELNRMNMINV